MHNDFLPHNKLQNLLDVLHNQGYSCLGPQVQSHSISYQPLTQVNDLAIGIEIEQSPGLYRIHQKQHSRYFSWSNGPQALKPLTFSAHEKLWSSHKDSQGSPEFKLTEIDVKPLAIIGIRPCDLAALSLQDQHFMQTSVVDSKYQQRRDSLFLIAVNCSHPSSTCFCHSTGDGPAINNTQNIQYDIVLDELDDGFVIKAGSEKAKQILTLLPLQTATSEHMQQAKEQTHKAQTSQIRELPGKNLQQQLFDRLDHDQWKKIADRCLSCGNCTMVCPSCFCYRETELAELNGESSQHSREWDSCFSEGHSYIHGFTVRSETQLRYRQWLTHKLGGWHQQFGRSGCVGCGRCISWCPVGIDLTEEVKTLLETNHV